MHACCLHFALLVDSLWCGCFFLSGSYSRGRAACARRVLRARPKGDGELTESVSRVRPTCNAPSAKKKIDVLI
jgi:hypothetical protein